MTGYANGGTRDGRKAVLVTIGPSHYCEKARWALDRLGIPYRDETHAPITHMPAVMRRRAGFTTPILVMDGEATGDSTAILRRLESIAPPELRLWPEESAERLEVSALESYFDEELAPQARTWVYTFARADNDVMFRVMDPGLSPREKAVFHRMVRLAGWAVGQRFSMDESSRARTLERVREVFRLVDDRISDGRRYLVGERFTAADLALGALGAPMVLPEGYGYPLPPLDALPAEMREAVEQMRETDTGRFIARLYRDERPKAGEPRTTASATATA